MTTVHNAVRQVGRRLPKSVKAAWLAALFAILASGTTAVSQDEPSGKQWALLIGCEKYELAPPLRFTVNDVQQIANTLVERGGFAPECILQITDANSELAYQPRQKPVMSAVSDWLKRPAANDTILVYFSGHGFKEPDGRMFLAPLDCDPRNAAATGIPVEWFRDQLAACRANFKLLILDSCHAGSEKGEDDSFGIGSKDLGERFRDMAGTVVTIASSTGDEKSQIWSEKQQSLFSYWLNQGLKGNADEDGDGEINIDELSDYVYETVTHTAKVRFARPQTPVRIIRSGVYGSPVVERLKPLTLKQLLSDIAEQFAWALEERKLPKVGVLEFSGDTPTGEALGGNFGMLGRDCADKIEQRLMKLSADKYSVIDGNRLHQVLSDQHMSVASLASSKALENLSAATGGMPVIAVGTLRNRKGRVVTLQCRLVRTDSDEVAASAGGTALLNENEWAMLGTSVSVRPEDRPAPLPGVNTEEEFIARLDEKADDPNPLTDPTFPFGVHIMVKGKERRPVVKGNDVYVGLNQGEEYTVNIENMSGQPVILKLLIDGLNTRLEIPEEKGITTTVMGMRVGLEEARGWLLNPADFKPGQRPIYGIPGFEEAERVGATPGTWRAFTVVDSAKSLAARQNYSDQLGLITAAFYSTGTSRGVATDTGRRIEGGRAAVSGYTAGNLLGVVHIHYVEESALPR